MSKRIAQFEKVSLAQFEKDWIDTFGNDGYYVITDIYNNIKIPKRATKGSAGYDFFSTCTFTLKPNEIIKIPTGVRCKINEGWVLKCYPRSSLGFKYCLNLVNQTAIVDEDYYYANNEGHIFIKMKNNGDKEVSISFGDKFVQGVFVEYGITIDDEEIKERKGGLGSTGA